MAARSVPSRAGRTGDQYGHSVTLADASDLTRLAPAGSVNASMENTVRIVWTRL